MKRTTKYAAFDVRQATTEGGQEKAQHPASQTARLPYPGGMLCAMTLIVALQTDIKRRRSHHSPVGGTGPLVPTERQYSSQEARTCASVAPESYAGEMSATACVTWTRTTCRIVPLTPRAR